jgi:hypothetical protein
MIKSETYLRFGLLRTVVNTHIVVLRIQQHVAWRMVKAVTEGVITFQSCRVDGGSMYFRHPSDHLKG